MSVVNSIDDEQDSRFGLRRRGLEVAKPEGQLEGPRGLQQLFGMERSESMDGHGDEFEMDGSVDRPGAELEIPGPGDHFEEAIKMPKRSFSTSESLSRDEPNRGVVLELVTPAPTEPNVMPVSMAPTTLTPTTLQPTTFKPTTLAPSLVTAEPTLQPSTEPPRRTTTLPPFSLAPTSLQPTTFRPTTIAPTTLPPTKINTPLPTEGPTSPAPVSFQPTTLMPTTFKPTTMGPTTLLPTTLKPSDVLTERPTMPPTSLMPTLPPTEVPTTQRPTLAPTSYKPTPYPTSQRPTPFPTSFRPTPMPVTKRPTPMPVTASPTLMPTNPPSITRAAQFKLPTAQGCELDYIVPEGAHADLIPCELIDELIMTLRRGEQLVEPLFGPYNSTYKMEEFLNALNTSYEWDVIISDNSVMDRNGNRRNLVEMQEMMSNIAPTPSPDAKQMNLGGENDGGGAKGRIDVAMAHMGLLLGQAYEESMITGMCDEQNTKPTDKVNPGCGQDGLNYRFPNVDGQLGVENHYTCFANENEWMTGYRPNPDEKDPRKNKEFVGCPLQPPIDVILSGIMPSNRPKNEYEEMPMMCGVDANIGSRGCCWWGRGMLQTTYQCDYGEFQQNWGSYYQVPDREDINLCANPGQVCSDVFPEMKYLTGLFTWTKKVVHNDGFEFMRELTEWVDEGRDYSSGGFIDRVGGALVYGDPNQTPPNAQERRNYMKAAVEAIMSLPANGVEQFFHYGNVAQCKPAVQSSIFNSTSDHTAHSALIGHRNASKIADTGCDYNPFWKVDLGSAYQIHSVHIVWYDQYHHEMMDIPEFNMTGGSDTMAKTNQELQVDLLDENGNNVASLERTQFRHSMDTDGKIENIWTIHVENSTDLVASQVRVSIATPDNDCNFLSLAEVKVMSVCELGDACLTKSTCEEKNVAQCKPTVQSSTVDYGTANLAVDGANADVATTECEEAPYFMVDLMDLYNITAVALINHADADSLNRLTGVVVELLDINDNVVAEDSHHPKLLGDEMGDVYIMKFDDTPAIACKVRVSLQHQVGTCESLKLSEVAVMATCLDDGEHCKTWDNCQHQNIGRCMPASQSSIFEGGIAARAVDGHTSLAHTKCEEEPWWGIHLLGSHLVKEVVIHNREDCCFDRLNNVQVALLDDAGNTLASVTHDPLTMGVIEDSWTAVFANTDAESISASKVRILTTHDPGTCEHLNLAEVQVMSPCAANDNTCLTWADCDNGNVAQCKPAEQSSTIHGDTAANAVNGHESLSHTDCEVNPWWEVDLLSPRAVNGVVIHNREDCCFERLNGILIELLDGNGAVTGSIQHDLVANGEINTMWVTTFADVMASKVRLSVQHGEGTCDFLNLAEVEVRSICVEGDACLTGFGCDHGNVAKCKPARQSSTLPASDFMTIYQGVAGDAVDGTESLAHTDCEQDPWWEVNLLYRREVSEVVLHNREDCCFERLNGVIVDLLDKEHNVISRVQHNFEAEGEINTMWVARFPPMSMAWYVRVMVENAAGTCDFLNLAEVEVISACEEGDACMNPASECVQGNVAQCKPARQISTVDGAVARNAVDSERSISRTDCEERPWWEVDLQGSYHVSEVVLFNRIDCCQEELNNVMVELVNATGHTVKMVQHDPITDGIINATWAAMFDHFGDYANKVRVSLLNEVGECKNLHLADIQVMSTCSETDACYYGYSCGDGNVAQCKPATQSSTRDGMVADKALDGKESLSMTECENSPWWTVDLKSDYNIKEVAVYNRRDCCFERLNGTLVELLDGSGGVIASAQHNPETMGMIQDVWVAHFDPANSAAARSVRVSVRHEEDTCDFLDLAEVQVYSACKENDACMTGFDCDHSFLQDA